MTISRILSALAMAAALGACGDATGPGAPSWLQVTAGHSHSCGVTADHRAWCWGRNLYGALGDGTTRNSAVPVLVAGGERFQSVSAGLDYSCGLTVSGGVACWGANFNGQLGNNSTANSAAPVTAATSGYRTVSAGESHTCGTRTDGATFCWGTHLFLHPGGSPQPDRLVPKRQPGPLFVEVSSGFEIACAITAAGQPYCWGILPPGVLISGSTQSSTDTPTAIATTVALVRLDASWKSACGLDAARHAWCWGYNGSGQLGDGTRTDAATPQPVQGGHEFAAISARGPSHACAVTSAGDAWCWGNNALGALGTGDRTSSPAPVAVAGGLKFASVATGFFHTCGVTPPGAAYCWGYGGYGQLGGGDTTDAEVPMRVKL